MNNTTNTFRIPVILSIALGLFLVGCSEDTAKVEETKASTVEVAKPVEAKNQIVANEPITLEKVVGDIKKIEIPSAESVQKSVETGVEIAKETIKSATSEAVEVVSSSIPASVNGKALYAKCSGCHGANGEKKALGKSVAIQAWDAQKTIDALNGYKDGSYGGAMKALMKGQVDKLSDDEIKAIADYISGL